MSPDDQQSVKLVEMLPSKMIVPNGMLQLLGNTGQGQWGNTEVANEYKKSSFSGEFGLLKWHRTAC